MVCLKNIDTKFHASGYDVNVNKYGIKCGTSLRFWENNGWFQWHFRYWLGKRLKDNKRQVNRCKNIVTRFRGKLVKKLKSKLVKELK